MWVGVGGPQVVHTLGGMQVVGQSGDRAGVDMGGMGIVEEDMVVEVIVGVRVDMDRKWSIWWRRRIWRARGTL